MWSCRRRDSYSRNKHSGEGRPDGIRGWREESVWMEVKNTVSGECQDLQSFRTAIRAALCCFCDRCHTIKLDPRWKLNLWPAALFRGNRFLGCAGPFFSHPPLSSSNLSQNKTSISPPHHFHTPVMPVATETTHYNPGDRSFPLAAPFDWPVRRWGCWGLSSFDWLAGWQRQRPQQTFCKEHWFNRLACGQTAGSHTDTHM